MTHFRFPPPGEDATVKRTWCETATWTAIVDSERLPECPDCIRAYERFGWSFPLPLVVTE